jgi:hypothetical protein
MDWLTAVIRLIEALALPIAALIIILVFRRDLRELVPFVRRLKAGPLEAEFERDIREISQEVGSTTRPEAGEEPDPRKIMLIELARLHPRSAILEAWLGVETAVRQAALQNVVSSPAPDVSSPLKSLRELVGIGALSQEDVALFHDLRGLRNQAAHAEAFEPSLDAALEYVHLASQLRSRLEKLADPRDHWS